MYTLNDEPACSLSATEAVDGVPANWLFVFSTNSDGIVIAATFFATTNIYYNLLPTAENIIDSIKIDSAKIKEIFGITESTNIQLEFSPIPLNQTSEIEPLIFDNQSNTNQQPDGFEISEF